MLIVLSTVRVRLIRWVGERLPWRFRAASVANWIRCL